jgi:DNA primase
MSRLLICEGPTDTAALIDMGVSDVVGRPSCTGGIKLLVELVKRRQPPDVVIVDDADQPGRRGADDLASALAGYVPSVRVVMPPTGIKDARDWLRVGGSREELEQAIEAVDARCGVICPRATVRSEGIST